MHKTRSFLNSTSGNVALIFGLVMLPLAGAAGLAVDYSRILSSYSLMQQSADSSVLAAAISSDKTNDEREDIGDSFFYPNMKGRCVAKTTYDWSVPNQVTVSSNCEINNHFMGLFKIPTSKIAVVSTAVFESSQSAPCILALNSSAKEAIYVNSESGIKATCEVQSNSVHSKAITVNDESAIQATKICTGNGSSKKDESAFSPNPVVCDPVDDPLSAIPIPSNASAGCDYTDLTIKSNKTIFPGVYCNKLEIKDEVDVTLSPGTYILKNAEFIVNSESSASGDGVLIYMSGEKGRFNIKSESSIDFKGLKSGPRQGIVFFQERNSTASSSNLDDESSAKIEGVIYLPNTKLKLSDESDLSNKAPWTVVIADTIEVNDESSLKVATDYEAGTVPLPDGIGGNSGAGVKNVRLIR